MRIVLDTNILVRSHPLAKGPARKLLRMIAGGHSIIFSRETYAELARAIHYPRVLAHTGMTEEEKSLMLIWPLCRQ